MIDKFWGEYRFLSNFWPATVSFGGFTYQSVEHAYQAAKSFDPLIRFALSQYSKYEKPGSAKKLGKHIKLRPNWEKVKPIVMLGLVRQKFKKHKDLAKKLLDTGDQLLIEGNTWGDTYWGVCRGVGENRLGKILMRVRNEINIQMGGYNAGKDGYALSDNPYDQSCDEYDEDE